MWGTKFFTVLIIYSTNEQYIVYSTAVTKYKNSESKCFIVKRYDIHIVFKYAKKDSSLSIFALFTTSINRYFGKKILKQFEKLQCCNSDESKVTIPINKSDENLKKNRSNKKRC